MRCKVINCNKHQLEIEINQWLNSGKYEIKHMIQTAENHYITLTILYLDKKEIRREKINKINNK